MGTKWTGYCVRPSETHPLYHNLRIIRSDATFQSAQDSLRWLVRRVLGVAEEILSSQESSERECCAKKENNHTRERLREEFVRRHSKCLVPFLAVIVEVIREDRCCCGL